jgi:hypothetical protein
MATHLVSKGSRSRTDSTIDYERGDAFARSTREHFRLPGVTLGWRRPLPASCRRRVEIFSPYGPRIPGKFPRGAFLRWLRSGMVPGFFSHPEDRAFFQISV